MAKPDLPLSVILKQSDGHGGTLATVQAAIKRLDNTLIFGDDVELALQNREITAVDRMFYLTPMSHDKEMEAERNTNMNRPDDEELMHLFGKLKMEDQLSACGESLSATDIPALGLYSGLLAWVWRAAAKYVSGRYCDLNWHNFTKFTQEENFPPHGQDVKVALLIPSKSFSIVRHRQFMVAAANTAGIPNLRLVSEAAAALAHHITICLETIHPADLIGKTLMMLDCGPGSVDLEVWTILNVNPLRTGQYSRKESGYGRIADLDALLAHLRLVRGQQATKVSFGNEVDAEFEEQKRGPNGVEERYLSLPDLPNDRPSRLHGDAGIFLSESDMTAIYDNFLRPIINFVCQTIEKVAEAKRGDKDNGNIVDGIIATGEGMLNLYVQESFQRQMDILTEPSMRSKISMHFPTATQMNPHPLYNALTRPALGGVLLLADDALVAERVVDRSYFAAEFAPDRTTRTIWIRPQYFARKGHVLPTNARTPKEPYEVELLNDGREIFDLKVHILCSDTIAKDIVELDERESRKLLSDALPWVCTVTKEDLAGVPLTQAGAPNDTMTCWHVEYTVELTFDGRNLCFIATVPRSGRLGPNLETGDNPIEKFCEIDFEGGLRPVGA
ncbi:hypothetical protein CLCR_09847 [Cladophialophora carrionii]|uniref:Hsp70 family chaperone n=1 Tax=Cladophialophora carrionii TaxID=86049 RepID=A0A1C1CVT8_9EURO|nr:hypothetical protein CLCR_09847 [Cladophialophora carrionii]